LGPLGTLHTFPKSFLMSSSCLGEPWMGKRGRARGLELRLLCLFLADSPPIGRGKSVRCLLAYGSSCSSRDLKRLCFDPFGQLFLVGRGLSDRPRRGTELSACGPDRPPRGRGPSARHQLLADFPRTRYGPSVFQCARLVVLLSLTDRQPMGSGPSTLCPHTVRPRFTYCQQGLLQDS
jgi:hypothetical protein